MHTEELNTEYLEKLVEQSGTHFQNMYLDWLNNFLTIDGFAAYYDMSMAQAEKCIKLGKKIHKQHVKNLIKNEKSS